MKAVLVLVVTILSGCAFPITVNGKNVTGAEPISRPDRTPFYGSW
jgi:hypothetical protein